MTSIILSPQPGVDPNVFVIDLSATSIVFIGGEWDGANAIIDLDGSGGIAGTVFGRTFSNGELRITRDEISPFSYLSEFTPTFGSLDLRGQFLFTFRESTNADFVFDGVFETSALMGLTGLGAGNTFTVTPGSFLDLNPSLFHTGAPNDFELLSFQGSNNQGEMSFVNHSQVSALARESESEIYVEGLGTFSILNTGFLFADILIAEEGTPGELITIINTGTMYSVVNAAAIDGQSTFVNQNEWTSEIETGAGDDVIRNSGTWFTPFIDTGAGNDRFDMRGGSGGSNRILNTVPSELRGGLGDDIYVVDALAEATNGYVVVEGADAGRDLIVAFSDYVLPEHVEDLLIFGDGTGTGNAGDNILRAPAGANLLDGLGGNDTLVGGGGTDTLLGGDGDDRLYLDDATAEVHGGADLDVLIANRSTAGVTLDLTQDTGTATGGGAVALSGIETVVGSDFGDVLTGSASTNLLIGGAGDDTLSSGGGSGNRLVGGAGADTFLFTGIEAAPVVITDFTSGADMVSFDGLGLTYIGTSAFTGVGSELRQVSLQGGTRTGLLVDFDGDGVHDMSAILFGAASVVESDLIL